MQAHNEMLEMDTTLFSFTCLCECFTSNNSSLGTVLHKIFHCSYTINTITMQVSEIRVGKVCRLVNYNISRYLDSYLLGTYMSDTL